MQAAIDYYRAEIGRLNARLQESPDREERLRLLIASNAATMADDDKAKCWLRERLAEAQNTIVATTKERDELLQRLTQQQEERDKRITRFELIDRRDLSGRVFTAKPCQIELSYQDEGRTLKIFLRNRYEELAQADLPGLGFSDAGSIPAGGRGRSQRWDTGTRSTRA